MANQDANDRGLPPQSSQMSTFSFAPTAAYQQPREIQQRNYVFVDEHNRHKRLKVMRACEGCRRRKIKCDAATTNSWPCSACVRLKLQCVRPTAYDGSTDGHIFDDLSPSQLSQNPPQGYQSPQQMLPPVQSQQSQQSQPSRPLQQSHTQSQSPQHSQQSQQSQLLQQASPPQHQTIYTESASYPPGPGGNKQPTMYAGQSIVYPASAVSSTAAPTLYGQMPYSEPSSSSHYTNIPQQLSLINTIYASRQHDDFPTPSLRTGSHPASPSDSAYVTNEDPASFRGGDLADLLGSLRMNEAGTAPYLNNRILARDPGNEDTPVVGDDDEYKSALPPLVSGPGSKIRIPPELMPSDDTILRYFGLFFANVHPYVPVLDKAMFYQQWHTRRESISPLLIEAVLAIGGRLADDPAQGQQWLALATKHADSFMDVPRLSTLQAFLVMLKAREAAPKRGYYYRSWMAIVQCVQMAKDLGLDEHYADHKAGSLCNSSPAECLMKTRIWQTIFVCEVMIGSPQGRTDLAVVPDSVDLREPPHTPGVDESDMKISRSFVYLTRLIANVARMIKVYARIKRNKDWGTDPEFTQLTPMFHSWPSELPVDLSITFPPNGSPPWLPSEFAGNMHSYYYLSILLLHRPQLQALDPSSPDGRWKHHMALCYSAAKFLCRLEEALLHSYGLNGLQNMQRGVNFSIYTILTCIVVHLVAITSPDPDFNVDAREYFTRHMRILEKCMNAWPMPDMQRQIDAMREAFSANVRKPFVLKPSFPYGSPPPTSSNQASPPHQQTPASDVTASTASVNFGIDQAQSVEQILQLQQQRHHQRHQKLEQPLPHSSGCDNQAILPPVSTFPADAKPIEAPPGLPISMMTAVPGQTGPRISGSMAATDSSGWNPSRIFDQWNSTFGTPLATQPSSATSQNSTLSVPSSSGSAEIPTLQDIQAVHASLPHGLQPIPVSPAYAQAPIQTQHTFITPAMWQESVASVYEGGLKRSWDYDNVEAVNLLKR